ncbi:hypothetical protein H8N00_19065 [Streptomyces sp. AC563]|uniref:hypothetical protein n=1 Tax=Streptomyces buecherae TaxID=2763006 RepID=UPI00164D1389|nr:hypothetical protein [Streptomyces buecherae]MBC3990939.1 hypothetical protein [Streptomyces buecherae]
MGERRTITREVRIFGALYCAFFATISLAWIIRDLNNVVDGADLWWVWVHVPYPADANGVVASSYYDLVLLVLYVATGLIVRRSPVAGSALVTVAVVTIALRLPSLWNLHGDWMGEVSGGTAMRAQLTCWSAVLASVMVLVAVARSHEVDRQAPPAFAPEDGAVPLTRPAGPPPGRRGRASAVLRGIGLLLIVWQIDFLLQSGWENYEQFLVGEQFLFSLLDQPYIWSAWTVTLIALAAGARGPSRAPHARPLVLIAAVLVTAHGVSGVSRYLELDHFGHLRGELFLYMPFVELLAGLVALLALASPGPGPVPGAAAGWGPPPVPAHRPGHPPGPAEAGGNPAAGHGAPPLPARPPRPVGPPLPASPPRPLRPPRPPRPLSPPPPMSPPPSAGAPPPHPPGRGRAHPRQAGGRRPSGGSGGASGG